VHDEFLMRYRIHEKGYEIFGGGQAARDLSTLAIPGEPGGPDNFTSTRVKGPAWREEMSSLRKHELGRARLKSGRAPDEAWNYFAAAIGSVPHAPRGYESACATHAGRRSGFAST
jgi:hypothetical protein